MATIIIEIDVLNAQEVLKNKKGKFIAAAVNLVSSEEKIKLKVEEEICKKIVEEMKENMDHAMREQGVLAQLKITALK